MPDRAHAELAQTLTERLAIPFLLRAQTVSMIWLEKEDGRHDGGRTAFAKGKVLKDGCRS